VLRAVGFLLARLAHEEGAGGEGEEGKGGTAKVETGTAINRGTAKLEDLSGKELCGLLASLARIFGAVAPCSSSSRQEDEEEEKACGACVESEVGRGREEIWREATGMEWRKVSRLVEQVCRKHPTPKP
jgi:hypothetical protein